MTEEKFIAKNEAAWMALANYNDRLLRKGIGALTVEEVREFADLFRKAGYHPAYAKTHYPGGAALPHLNRVVGVAHNFFYVRETDMWPEIGRYFAYDLPGYLRGLRGYFVAALLLFLAGLVFAHIYVSIDPANAQKIIAGAAIGGAGEVVWDYPLMSAYIMTNNIRVALLVFALGITAGIGTVVVLFYNGVVIGALVGLTAASGQPGAMLLFSSLILPHGILELAAIFVSGACGLMIGKAMLIPGVYRRKDAVVKCAKHAVRLIPGVVIMLILAAVIEGYFTPLGVPAVAKLVFAGLSGVALLLYGARRQVPVDRRDGE